MVALSADRNTPERDGKIYRYAVGAAATIYAGALVALDATGYVVPGSTATTLTAVGRAEDYVDNSAGADGDATVDVRRGVFRFVNSAAGDEITAADIGGTAYIVDDQTVAKTDGTATRSVAGTIRDVDPLGVWVEI